MKTLILLIFLFMGTSDITYLSFDDVQGPAIEHIITTCDELETTSHSDLGLMSNPCSGLSNCSENNNTYCGHVDVSDPDGPDYTAVCRGRGGSDPEVN